MQHLSQHLAAATRKSTVPLRLPPAPALIPALPNLSLTACCRHLYARFTEADGMVVPYHPAVLLAWGAHMNLQAVTDTALSFYLLKYAAKQQVPASLVLDGKALAAWACQPSAPSKQPWSQQSCCPARCAPVRPS